MIDQGQRVYFAQCDFGGPIKIGHSYNRLGRIAALSLEIPFNIVEIGSVPGGLFREKFLHAWFRSAQVRREWFQPTPELWRWALEARTRGEILELPQEPPFGARFSLEPIKYWLRKKTDVRLERLARAAGCEIGTLKSYLKKSEGECRISTLAAYAVCQVKAGNRIDWSGPHWMYRPPRAAAPQHNVVHLQQKAAAE